MPRRAIRGRGGLVGGDLVEGAGGFDGAGHDDHRTDQRHGVCLQAEARNRVNLGARAEKEATPQGTVITAPDTVWFAENRADSVATLSAEDPEGHAVTWSRMGQAI